MGIKVGEFEVEFMVDYDMYTVKDSKGRTVHTKSLNGFEDWTEYYGSGAVRHYRNTEDVEFWFNPEGVRISEHEYNMMMLPVVLKVNQQ